MPYPESEPQEKKILVRGADGALYALTKTGPPQELTEEQTTKIEEVVKKAEEDLADALDKEVPQLAFGKAHSIRVTIPEVFMDQ